MPSKNTTTVVLTEKGQIIKEDLAPVFGLKNILSAGLVLFAKLSSDDQKASIQEANHGKNADKCPKCGRLLLKKRKSKSKAGK